MRIYCSEEFGGELEQFVGTDIWIKAYYKSKCYWVKILSEQSDEYSINKVLCNLDSVSSVALGAMMNKVITCSKYDIIPVHPIETLSTDDILDRYE